MDKKELEEQTLALKSIAASLETIVKIMRGNSTYVRLEENRPPWRQPGE